jgi:hypothetical protein
MADISDQMPEGGYILPNFPTGYWRDNPNAQQLFGLLDQVIDQEWSSVRTLDEKYDVDKAVGGALDDIGATINLPRFGGIEDDDHYRRRIEQATELMPGASNNQRMANFLAAMFDSPVTVEDGAAEAASFTVTLQRSGPFVGHVVPLVKQVKAAGTVFTVLVIGQTGAPNRLRDVRLRDAFVGRPQGGLTFGGS